MRETGKIHLRLKALILAVATVMTVALAFGMATIVSHAEEGRVTARSVNIRASADTNSDVVGGAMQGQVLTIVAEVTGADNKVWYQVTFEGNKTGYVRSDLMEKVGGGTATAPGSTPSDEVVALQPVTAKITGQQVNVRSNASTSGSVVSTVQKDVVLTIVGMSKDSEDKTWYQVKFSDANGEVTGFVREDVVTVEGELVPAVQDPPEQAPPDIEDPVQPETPPAPVPAHKDFETQYYEDDGWYLLDYTVPEGRRYLISDLFDTIENNKKKYEESQAKLKSMQMIMIVLVVAVILLALTATMLFFKIRDMMDAAYFEEVEKEVVRKKQGQRSSAKGSMPTVGAGTRQAGGSGQSRQPRPSGSSGNGQQGGGSGQPRQPRPSGVSGNGQQGNGQPRQPRPSGASGNGQQGRGQSRQPEQPGFSEEPVGQRRPGQPRPAAQQEKPAPREQQGAPKQPKNFLADEDEFEFEYLDWDGEDGD